MSKTGRTAQTIVEELKETTKKSANRIVHEDMPAQINKLAGYLQELAAKEKAAKTLPIEELLETSQMIKTEVSHMVSMMSQLKMHLTLTLPKKVEGTFDSQVQTELIRELKMAHLSGRYVLASMVTFSPSRAAVKVLASKAGDNVPDYKVAIDELDRRYLRKMRRWLEDIHHILTLSRELLVKNDNNYTQLKRKQLKRRRPNLSSSGASSRRSSVSRRRSRESRKN
mmetsp:Transcript_22696/g.25259  ORF Transcript_22696/g.25259 Transcript_22696/m.25259 type:complete len:226 (-) Transcript_22696:106-783(-)